MFTRLLQPFMVLAVLIFSHQALAADPPAQLRNVKTGLCLQANSNQAVQSSMAACNADEPRQFFTNITTSVTNAFGKCMDRRTPTISPNGFTSADYVLQFVTCNEPLGSERDFKYDLASQQIKVSRPLVSTPVAPPLIPICFSGTPIVIDQRGFPSTLPYYFGSCPLGGATNASNFQWEVIPQTRPPKTFATLIQDETGLCFQTNSATDFQTAICNIGEPSQTWIHTAGNQIVNANGQCLAAYPNTVNNNVILDTCQGDANHEWLFTNGKMLKNSATQLCFLLDYNQGSTSTCDLPSYQNVFFIPPASTPPPQNNLIAKNDSYGAVANFFHGQLIFDIPAAKGVRVNDTPSGWPAGLTFEMVDQVKRTAGVGKAVMSVFFRDSGGFYATIRTEARTMASRQADKRGTYQFTYRMVMNGQYSAPATVTLSVY